MKQLKMFGLALIAALGLSILAAAGTAQATVLCTTEDTSECTMTYPKGTAVDLSLKSGTSMTLKNTGSELLATCTGSTVKGKTGAEAGSSVPVELSEWSWSGCSQTTDTVAAGSLEVKRIEGTHNGTVTGKGSEWTFGILGVSCTYGTGTGTDLGTLTGGAEPVLKANVVINKTGGGFICPGTVKFEAEFVVTEPHALYVENVSRATVLCTTEDTSECTMTYPKGTAVDLSLKSGTSMTLKNTGSELLATCTGSTVKGKTGAEAGSSVPVELSEWSWSGCSQTTDTLAAGLLEVKRIEGTHNGTVTGSGSEWTFGILGVSCTYGTGTGTGTDLGTLTGGAEPVLKAKAVINKISGGFICPSTVNFEAEFVVTEPHALYVIQERPTILCTTEETACGMSYASGTAVDLSLKSGTSMTLKKTEGELLATCTGSTVKGKTGAEAGSSVPVELSEWSWSGCSQTTDAVAAGSLEVKRIEGTHNGTVTGKGSEWTFGIFGVSCTYGTGTGTGTDLGTLTGGAEPALKANVVINKTGGGFICPGTVKFEAEFVVTEPHALYVI